MKTSSSDSFSESIQSNENNILYTHQVTVGVLDRFQRHAKDLLEVLLSKGYPFEVDSEDRVTLDNKVRESAAAAVSVRMVE